LEFPPTALDGPWDSTARSSAPGFSPCVPADQINRAPDR